MVDVDNRIKRVERNLMDDSKEEPMDLSERMEDYRLPGMSVSVIDGGEIDWSKGYGVLEKETDREVDVDSVFHACSMSKFATAMVVMELVGRDELDLDEDVNEYLRNWKVSKNKFTAQNKVTLRLLLSHQGGFMDPEKSFKPYDEKDEFPELVNMLNGETRYLPDRAEVKYVPGGGAEYSDTGYCVIEQLLEDFTGDDFSVLADELVFGPLGMENSYFKYPFEIDDLSNFAVGHTEDEVLEEKRAVYPYLAAAGLWSTPTDLSKMIIELMDSLDGEGKLSIGEDLAEEMITSQSSEEWAGLGVFLNQKDDLIASSLGWGRGFQCMLQFYPNLKKGGVVMINSNLGTHQVKNIIGEVLRSIDHVY
ncbi:MAG: serine hydrolase domain-containing protein [Thermoplasmatota archaeon]